jgi:hypothetical protein
MSLIGVYLIGVPLTGVHLLYYLIGLGVGQI